MPRFGSPQREKADSAFTAGDKRMIPFGFYKPSRKIGFSREPLLSSRASGHHIPAHSSVGRQEESEPCRFPSCLLWFPCAFWRLRVAAVPPRKRLLPKALRPPSRSRPRLPRLLKPRLPKPRLQTPRLPRRSELVKDSSPRGQASVSLPGLFYFVRSRAARPHAAHADGGRPTTRRAEEPSA